MTGLRKFFDSNILIYLVDKDIKKSEKVVSIASSEDIISTQVIGENVNVCIKKLKL